MMETYSEGANIVRILSENMGTKDKPRIMITSVDLKGPWEAYPQDEWLACDVLLQKPVSPDDLLKCVRDALART